MLLWASAAITLRMVPVVFNDYIQAFLFCIRGWHLTLALRRVMHHFLTTNMVKCSSPCAAACETGEQSSNRCPISVPYVYGSGGREEAVSFLRSEASKCAL